MVICIIECKDPKNKDLTCLELWFGGIPRDNQVHEHPEEPISNPYDDPVPIESQPDQKNSQDDSPPAYEKITESKN